MTSETIIEFIDSDGDTISIGSFAQLEREYGTSDLGEIKRVLRRESGTVGPIRRVDTKPGTDRYLALTAVDDDPIAEFEAIQAEIYADLDERARHLAAAEVPTMPDDPAEQFAFARPYGYDGGRCVECGATDGDHYGNCGAVD